MYSVFSQLFYFKKNQWEKRKNHWPFAFFREGELALAKNTITGIPILLTVTAFCLSDMFGAVVVGIGTAGLVRIRDMLAPLPASPAEKLAVKGFISR